jgi:hypothetical protein
MRIISSKARLLTRLKLAAALKLSRQNPQPAAARSRDRRASRAARWCVEGILG